MSPPPQKMDALPSPHHPPLFQSHGKQDTLVLPWWGKETHKQLSARGVKGKLFFVTYAQFSSNPIMLGLDEKPSTKRCWTKSRSTSRTSHLGGEIKRVTPKPV